MKESTASGGKVAVVLSVVSGIVAVLGLVFAVTRFVTEEVRQREAQLLSQARSDLEQLVALPTRDNAVASTAQFLLDDLSQIAIQRPEIDERVTAVLREMATHD